MQDKLKNEDLQKLQGLVKEVEIEESIMTNEETIEKIVRKVIQEESDILQSRIVKGILNVIYKDIRDIYLKGIEGKLDKIIKMAEIDDKRDEILEYMNKLQGLMGGE